MCSLLHMTLMELRDGERSDNDRLEDGKKFVSLFQSTKQIVICGRHL